MTPARPAAGSPSGSTSPPLRKDTHLPTHLVFHPSIHSPGPEGRAGQGRGGLTTSVSAAAGAGPGRILAAHARSRRAGPGRAEGRPVVPAGPASPGPAPECFPFRRAGGAEGFSPESPAVPSLPCGAAVWLSLLSLGSPACLGSAPCCQTVVLLVVVLLPHRFHKSIGRRSGIPVAWLLSRVTAPSRPDSSTPALALPEAHRLLRSPLIP